MLPRRSNPKKVAFLFPGSGSQHAGMGRSLYQSIPSVRRALESLPDEASTGLREVMFTGRDDLLFPPVDSPVPSLFFEVIVALSLSVASALREEGAMPDCVAGRSLGEFSSFAFSGVISPGFCFSVVQEFSRLGQRNCIRRPSLLMTVYGTSRRQLEDVCARLAVSGRVCELVNFYKRLNTGVVGMDASLAASFKALLPRTTKTRLCREVGAFHTSLFSDTAEAVNEMVMKQKFLKPDFPLYCGSDGRRHLSPAGLKRRFVRAVDGPVLWEEVLKAMLKDGVRIFVEIAPGAMLTEFICSLPADAMVLRTDTPENFWRTANFLKKNAKR